MSFLFSLMAISLLVTLSACDQPHPPGEGVSATLHQTDTQGFERATELRSFHFPAIMAPMGISVTNGGM